MEISRLKFQNEGCFKKSFNGFEAVRPINIIIGRNNTGKSQLLELVKVMCEGLKQDALKSMEFECEGILDMPSLRRHFLENHSGGALPGSHWHDNGMHFVDVPIVWNCGRGATTRNVRFPPGYRHPRAQLENVLDERRVAVLTSILDQASTPLQGRKFRHLLADRDIRAEVSTADLKLDSDGAGATNVIRKFITSRQLPRELIQVELLSALNEIFGPDGSFTEIQVRQHDDSDQAWEVFLGEEKKGLIPLSRSGSGLKTVILVLLFLHVMPKIENTSIRNYAFAFEELENNLHPALLRSLLRYVEAFALKNDVPVFLTTHSSSALDMFGAGESAQIVHVTHDREAASAVTVDAHFDRLGVISELGAKPSDLLQANGIIWVEGPSDAIYVTRWIELITGGKVREGRDFAVAFYGGALLARTQFVDPESALNDMVNLIRLNPNVVVICDGDRTKQGAKLKPRVLRIRKELESIPGSFCWITDPKEIESYLPGAAFQRALSLRTCPKDPGQFEKLFPGETKDGTSYIERELGLKSIDKIELAAQVVARSTLDEMQDRFDWRNRMGSVVAAIRRWNE